MSYSIYYNSFNQERADKSWENFGTDIYKALENGKKIEELEAKAEENNVWNMSEEEIYNPLFKVQVERKKDELIRSRRFIVNEIKDLESQSPVATSNILYYINKQTPIESDLVIQEMVAVDLTLGGNKASYASSLDPISEIAGALVILFPELSKDGELSREDFILLSKTLEEFDSRVEKHKNELIKNENLYIKDAPDFEHWKNSMREYFLQLKPVADDIAAGALYFTYTDSDGMPDSPLLKTRAEKHIQELKDHPLMKIPLQDHKV